MNEFVYKLTLDLNCAKTPPVICSGQFDKGRKFEFSITANGEPYDVTGCSAVLKGVRTDGSHFAVECTVSDGKIIKTLDDTTLSVRGKTVAKLVISDSEKSYSTQIFIIDVDSALDGDITVADDYSILNRLIEQIHALNESGAILIDDTIDESSKNAVANKAVAMSLADKEIAENKVTDKTKITDERTNYPSIRYLFEYYYDYNEVDELLTKKADAETTSQELIDTLPQFMSLATVAATRAIYVDGQYLYHCGNSSYAVSKNDIGVEVAPTQVKKIGGHAKTVTRGIAAGNGYLYVPYRDNVAGTGTTHGSDDDVGGYLDIINLTNFTLVKTITYPREPYDPGDGKGVRYYGKSHNAATYDDKYLCVTQQLGGWLLYDISTTPENPTLLYKCDNRAQSATDNTEFQQPDFYSDGTTVYLAIAGYDRHLLKIYNLNDPTYPICVYSGDLRELWQHEESAYLHSMGLVCKYPFIYCSVAPHPSYIEDFNNSMQGVAVVDVADINRVKVNFYKIPDESRTINSGGEPSPQSVAVTKNHLVMDMFDKGISVWSLANPAEPKFLGNLDTGATKVCSVLSTEDGRTFIGTEYQGGNLTMYRGL